jgi:hypothetical protein
MAADVIYEQEPGIESYRQQITDRGAFNDENEL